MRSNLALLPGEQSQYSEAGPEACRAGVVVLGLRAHCWIPSCTGPWTLHPDHPLHPLQGVPGPASLSGLARYGSLGSWVVPRYYHPVYPPWYHTRYPLHRPTLSSCTTPPGHGTTGTCTYGRFGTTVGEPRGIRTHTFLRVLRVKHC